MKKALLITVVIACVTNVFAQKNRLSISINTLDVYKFSYVYADTVDYTASAGIHFLPCFGYYKRITDHVIIGCDAGYTYIKEALDDTYIGGDEIDYVAFADHNKQYYLCPSISEQFVIKNYIINIGIVIPLLYKANEVRTDYRSYKSRSTNAVFREVLYEDKLANQLNIGAFADLGIQYKIYGKFYFGVHLGFGIDNVFIRGDTHNYIKSTESGNVTEVHALTETKYSTSKFDIRPTLSVNYNF